MDFLIKLERDAKKIKYAKEIIATVTDYMQDQQGLSGLRVNVDVDPV
jgi:hypothetical protein